MSDERAQTNRSIVTRSGRRLVAALVIAWVASIAPARAQSPDPPPPAQPVPLFRWEDHATFRAGDQLRMELRLRVQNDVRDTDGPLPPGEDEFKIPLKRFGVRGTFGRSIDFQVDHEVVRDNGWRDVFVNVRWRPALNVRAGQFKLPISLDENSSLTALDFLYRARAARQLAPGRDPGVMAHGWLLGDTIRYDAGVFRSDGRNARRPDPDRVQGRRTFAGRIRVSPLVRQSSVWRTLDVGIATSRSRLPHGLPAIRGRTALDATFFSSDHAVGGSRQRVAVEVAWLPGPFGVKSEYIRLSDDRPDAAASMKPLVGIGWYVSGMWVVTGEAKSAGLTVPARPVHRGGPGTIELAGRVEALGFRDGAAAKSATRLATAGINWQLNRWVRVVFNVIRERLEDPARPSGATQPVFWHRVFRVQFVI